MRLKNELYRRKVLISLTVILFPQLVFAENNASMDEFAGSVLDVATGTIYGIAISHIQNPGFCLDGTSEEIIKSIRYKFELMEQNCEIEPPLFDDEEPLIVTRDGGLQFLICNFPCEGSASE